MTILRAGAGAGWRAGRASLLVVAVLLGLALTALAPGRAGAQAPQQSYSTKDPSAITFSARATSGELKSARLEYQVMNPQGGSIGGSGEGTITGNDASFTLQTNTQQRYIPVGSTFRYRWTLTGSDGKVTNTPEDTFVFLDGRFQWASRSNGNATVYWHSDNERAALATLAAARASLDQTGALLRTKVDYPVNLVTYRSDQEGRPARQPRGTTVDSQTILGGQRVTSDVLLIYTDKVVDRPCEDPGGQDVWCVVAHEVAHIVTHVAGDGPFTTVPAWLDEGTAVYGQTPDHEPGSNYRMGVQMLISADQTLPLRSINSPVAQPALVNGFYGQSWSTVKFMIDTYGEAKFAELYRTIFEGARIDDALMKVYGFDQDGLYNQWREKNGLKPIVPSARATAGAAAVVTGTVPPLGVPSGGVVSAETPAASGPGGAPQAGGGAAQSGPGRGAAIAILGGTLAITLLLGGGAFMLLRRR